ncbi:ATP-binding SpoIIE family protein phosphatase [Actinacidiphila yeochonensis]|uniref:ATP-binding SpoIIE family protein phosphatase n=1 Tax=Actinacidiphila yeochonensis TaxID=89050 RepID=UPI001E30F537|nr:SpoIIE family protein phosphatase [Actinacidiphila yeochonensis]
MENSDISPEYGTWPPRGGTDADERARMGGGQQARRTARSPGGEQRGHPAEAEHGERREPEQRQERRQGQQGPEADEAELRQIDALNRLEGPLPPEAGRSVPTRGDRAVPEAEPAGPGGGGPEGSPAPAGGRASARGGGDRARDAALLDTGHTVADAGSMEEALKALSALAAPDFRLDGQAVFGVQGHFLTSEAIEGFRPGGTDRSFRMPLSTNYPAVEVVRTGRPVFLATAEEYRSRFPGTYPLTARKGRRSWAYVPLVSGGRLSGVWLAAFREPVAFTAEERALLTVASRLVARALERTRTGEAELALSRGLRGSMGRAGTSVAGPSVTGLSVATRYVPTGGGLVVGGDWVDSIALPNGRLALVIGDVQGHDVHAAGIMTQLRTAVHAYAAEGHGPDAVLARASRFLAALDEERFATCIYMEADPATGMLQVARAGHPHPVLRLPDGTCMIKHVRGGLPLGLIPGAGAYEDYPVSVVELRDGEVLMLCTDGLIETGGHDMYSGWVRVRDAMSPAPARELEGMADRLVRAVTGPSPDEAERGPEPDLRRDYRPRNEDDIALLLVRRDGGAGRANRRERRLVLTIAQDRAEALSGARTELRALLHDWARPDQVDTAVLLASELLGNVLVHTDQTATFNALVSGDAGRRTLRVEVTDRGDELPHQRAPGEMASSGRGLVLLDLLSDQWGVRPEAEGKTVWYALHEDQTPA